MENLPQIIALISVSLFLYGMSLLLCLQTMKDKHPETYKNKYWTSLIGCMIVAPAVPFLVIYYWILEVSKNVFS